jgi:putative solute:sodium symporter small subunit
VFSLGFCIKGAFWKKYQKTVRNGRDSPRYRVLDSSLLCALAVNFHLSSQAYWKATIALLTKILIIWAAVSFGAGILFAPMLNNIMLGGYPLGFWFAQQGSIYVFIVLIFYYAKKMNDLDVRFDVHED